jgi:hypothetical protein
MITRIIIIIIIIITITIIITMTHKISFNRVPLRELDGLPFFA